MTIFKNIWADLVDKRLWPVLAVLLLALVAIPLLLLKSGDDSGPSAPPIPSAAAPTASRAVVSVDGQASTGVKLSGASRDPFRGNGGQPDTTSSASSAGPAPGPAAPSSGAGTTSATSGASGTSGGGASTSSGTTSDTGAAPTPSPSSSGGSTPSLSQTPVIVRFGKAGGSKTRRAVAALEPLPTRSNPLLVYLGEKDGKGEFLVSSDVTLGGAVDCKPSKDVCEKAAIKPGTTISLDVAGGDQYVIEVLSAGS